MRSSVVCTSTNGSSQNAPREPVRTICTAWLRRAASSATAVATAALPARAPCPHAYVDVTLMRADQDGGGGGRLGCDQCIEALGRHVAVQFAVEQQRRAGGAVAQAVDRLECEAAIGAGAVKIDPSARLACASRSTAPTDWQARHGTSR